jgi:hypothetical protein
VSWSKSIVALLLVFLIGSPLCCCAAGCGQPKAAPEHSCCAKSGDSKSGDKAPDRHVCNCRSKDPREAAKLVELPGDPIVPLPVVIATVPELPAPPIKAVVATRHFFPGNDPPRTRLARYSRWLI